MSTPKLPDVNQLQSHMQYFIAYLVVHNKPGLLKIIRDNGIALTNPSDQDVITAVYVGIRNSNNFRKDLQGLMTETAATELNLNSPGGRNNFVGSSSNVKNVNDFVKGGAAVKTSFSNFTEDGGHTENGEAVPHGWDTPDPTQNAGVGGGVGDYKTMQGVEVVASKKASSTKTKKAFADTGLGGFLSNLFTKANVEKAAGVGIDLLGQKLSSKANINEANAATQLQLAQTEKYRAEIAAAEKRKSWLVPALIIGGLVAVAIVIIVVSKKKKPTA
jgi:hypothetical protein